jgi:hypothetical protein
MVERAVDLGCQMVDQPIELLPGFDAKNWGLLGHADPMLLGFSRSHDPKHGCKIKPGCSSRTRI